MKKSYLILLFTSLLTITGCGDANNPEPKPDPQPTPCITHVDNNKDHKCDVCGVLLSDHTYVYDKDNKHKCSLCGDIQPCVDENDDTNCDICGHKKEIKTETLLYTVCGNDFKAKFTNGTQFGTDHQENVGKLKDYFNNQTPDNIILESLNCVSMNCLDDLNKDGSGNRYLTAGSSKKGGSIEFICSVNIVKVEVTAMNYHNTYTDNGGGFNVDKASHLIIDTNDFSLEMTEDKIPEEKTFSLEYDTPVKTFKLSSKDIEKARVFLKTIKITFEA